MMLGRELSQDVKDALHAYMKGQVTIGWLADVLNLPIRETMHIFTPCKNVPQQRIGELYKKYILKEKK